MDSPISLSQDFVNKQNVRSYCNILKNSILKHEDNSKFLQLIFGKRLLVSELSSEIINNLLAMRTNLRLNVRENFKNFFVQIKKEENLCPVDKAEVFSCCWTCLAQILPKSFFGQHHNVKIFKKLVQSTVFSMKRQHIMLSKLLEKWDFASQPWSSLAEDTSKMVLFHIVVWIIKFILSPIISLNFYVTTCKLDGDENKLHFFWKNQWQSFYDKKISQMTFSKMLKRYEPYCVGKKTKKIHNISERIKIRSLHKDIPRLHLVLKPNGDCRPIVRYKNDQQTKSEKYKIKERFVFLKTLTDKTDKKIETQFNKTHQQWRDFGKPELYFVKTDLSNAFGSIHREKLMKFLCEKHLHFQKNEKSAYVKKKVAQQYREMVAELRKPLLVRAGNTIYEWTEGLVQGYKYSPALSELYYTCLDEIYFAEHLKKSESQIKLFIRVVDDYLYITNSLDDAHLFLKSLSNYRNVNYEKTIVNFSHYKIKLSTEITFLGYSYNTSNLQVSRANNIFTGQMCYKIAFSSASGNLNKFLENRIGQSGIQINSHIFNFVHNTEELIWRHIFTTFCLSANKFCTILAVLCEENDMQKYVVLYKKRVAVKLSNTIIGTLMKTKPSDYLFMYCINHFRYLALKALYLCTKLTPKCSGLVPLINDELAKTNCLFGKWKQHACRIETSGEMRRPAIKEVCKRADLRMIVKTFNTLPCGFQCHNHKRLL